MSKHAQEWLSGGYTASPYWTGVYLDVDKYYGGQCWDLTAAYEVQFYGHLVHGNAIAMAADLPAGWTTSPTPVNGCFFVKNLILDGINYGHTGGVIEVYPNGTMKTLEQNAGADWSLDSGSKPETFTRKQTYAFTYLIPPEEQDMVTSEDCYIAFNNARMRPPSQDELDMFVDKWELSALNKALNSGTERETVVSEWMTGKQAMTDNWSQQISDSNKRNSDLGKSVTIKDDEIKRLTAQLAIQSNDTELLNGFGAWLTKIIVRLGLKG